MFVPLDKEGGVDSDFTVGGVGSAGRDTSEGLSEGSSGRLSPIEEIRD